MSGRVRATAFSSGRMSTATCSVSGEERSSSFVVIAWSCDRELTGAMPSSLLQDAESIPMQAIAAIAWSFRRERISFMAVDFYRIVSCIELLIQGYTHMRR
jgi:hypothetical protein